MAAMTTRKEKLERLNRLGFLEAVREKIGEPTSDEDHEMIMVTLQSLYDEDKKQNWLVLALQQCLKHNKPVPEWASAVLLAGIQRVRNYEATSWDEVFGVPHGGRKVKQLRISRRLRFEVFVSVMEYRFQTPKPKDIFQTVAEELCISRATCKRYFDQANKQLQQAGVLVDFGSKHKAPRFSKLP